VKTSRAVVIDGASASSGTRGTATAEA